MGLIGIPRNDLLHSMRWWEVLSVIRGYNLRNRDMWSSTRWQTYNILSAVCGAKSLRENGIHSAKDLLTFPWEDDKLGENDADALTDEDIAELQADIDRLNNNT